MSSNFKLPWHLAKITARSLSDIPLQFNKIHPLASGGNFTPDFRLQRSNVSKARALHWRKVSLSLARNANTSAMFSPISSVLSFSGHLLSKISKMAFSPPSFWYSASDRCSTVSSALPCKSVQMKLPRASFGSLSITRILLMAHCFHRLYSR